MNSLTLIVRWLVAIVSIAAFWLLVNLPLVIIGFFVVPLCVFAKLYREQDSPIRPDRKIINPIKLFWLWGNDQEGWDPRWYKDRTSSWSKKKRMIIWAAWRNSVNNLRFVKALHPPPVPGKIHWWISSSGKFTLIWQGWLHRIIYHTEKFDILAGWKYDISHNTEVSVNDWRRFGVGFGIRKRGKNAPIGDYIP